MKRCDFLGFFSHPMRGMVGQPAWPEFDLEAGFDLDLIHVTAAFPGIDRDMLQILSRIEKVKQAIETRSDRLMLVRDVADLCAAEESKKCAVVLGLQWTPPDFNIGALYDAGIRVMAPCYQGNEALGSGYRFQRGRLTRLGEKFVDDCAKSGMIVDVSHASHDTARGVLMIAERNEQSVVATHSASYSVYPHNRNITDDIARQIAALDGIIGVPTMTFFLDGEDNTLAPFRRHVARFLELTDPASVAVGSDNWYCHLDPEKMEQLFNSMKARMDPNDEDQSRYPDQPPVLNSAKAMDHLVAATSAHPSVSGDNLWEWCMTHLFF